jgi:tRNA nucleotidyltransferase/poly(A) polymerase
MHDILNRVMPILKAIKEKHGKPYIVGGAVRDLIRGKDLIKDLDIEVFNLKKEQLIEILSKFGKINELGKQFSIFQIQGFPNIDIAIPRTEKKTGLKHQDFKIETNPFLSIKEAAKRRDLTVNAIYYDPFNQEFIDPYNGIKDLKNHCLKMVNSNKFKEDPLRVLRIAQFSARFSFNIEKKTMETCKQMVSNQQMQYLSFDIINIEITKLWNAKNPYLGLKFLIDINYYQSLKITNILISHSIKNQWLHNLALLTYNKNNQKYIKQLTLSINQTKQLMQYLNILNEMKMIKNIIDYTFLLEKINSTHIDFNQIYQTYKIVNHPDLILTYFKQIGSKAPKRLINGYDLINLGFINYSDFKELLNKAYQLQINGNNKKEIINFLRRTKNETR